jgi:glycosyltransferase involved in cell wall biosynthesis
MKVSVITACYNSVRTIADAMESVGAQTHSPIEHIVVDGLSTDGTQEILSQYRGRISTLVSERDDGIYDALNKGVRCATGDIIGFLHSDDRYADRDVIENVVRCFQTSAVDVVYGNIHIVDPEEPKKLFRVYRPSNFQPYHFKFGLMPPHPAVFMRKEVYDRFGLFKLDYAIAADFEFLLRIFTAPEIRTKFIDSTLVIMRKGGASSKNLTSNFIINTDMLNACRENGVRTNYMLIYAKYFVRLLEVLKAIRINRRRHLNAG